MLWRLAYLFAFAMLPNYTTTSVLQIKPRLGAHKVFRFASLFDDRKRFAVVLTPMLGWAKLLTAYAQDSDRNRCIASGFQMHIPKPIDPEALVLAVSKL